jgi:hypothetical protein
LWIDVKDTWIAIKLLLGSSNGVDTFN